MVECLISAKPHHYMAVVTNEFVLICRDSTIQVSTKDDIGKISSLWFCLNERYNVQAFGWITDCLVVTAQTRVQSEEYTA